MIDTPTAAAIASVCTVLLAALNLLRQELVARRVASIQRTVNEERIMLARLGESRAYDRGRLATAYDPIEPPPNIEPK